MEPNFLGSALALFLLGMTELFAMELQTASSMREVRLPEI